MTSASTFSEPETAVEEQREKDEVALRTVAEINSLPERQPPPLADSCILHGDPLAADEVTVILSQAALRQIAEHSNSDLRCELGGALLGRAYRFEGRLYLDVQAAIPAVTEDHGPVHFTFTADAWSQLHKDRAERHPSLDIVGWFHTHPDLGVFYSSDDVVVHTAAFSLPWHVGMVIDPYREQTSFFGWKGGLLAPLPGFYELCELEADSVVTWRVVPAEVWDEPYEVYETDGEERPYQSHVYLPSARRPALPPLSPYTGLIAGALGFLLAFFLLVGWVIPLSREVDRLEGTLLVLADRVLADSNAAACPDPRLRILTPLVEQRASRGETLEIVGTADYPTAARYQVQIRPFKDEAWTLLNTLRRDMTLGQLAEWETETYAPGMYEIRLMAVDGNNIPLKNTPSCMIALELGP